MNTLTKSVIQLQISSRQNARSAEEEFFRKKGLTGRSGRANSSLSAKEDFRLARPAKPVQSVVGARDSNAASRAALKSMSLARIAAAMATLSKEKGNMVLF